MDLLEAPWGLHSFDPCCGVLGSHYAGSGWKEEQPLAFASRPWVCAQYSMQGPSWGCRKDMFPSQLSHAEETGLMDVGGKEAEDG